MIKRISSKNGLSAFHLKLIALSCMIIDHIGVILLNYRVDMLNYIGRIAFPIYAFLVAEGCRHTRDRKQYLLRLGIFALISELPFDFAFHHAMLGSFPRFENFLGLTNVFFTLFLSIACIHIFETLKNRTRAVQLSALAICVIFLVAIFFVISFVTAKKPHIIILFYLYLAFILVLCEIAPSQKAEEQKRNYSSCILAVLPLLPIFMQAIFINCDYGVLGVLLIFSLYFSKKREMTVVIIITFCLALYGRAVINAVCLYGEFNTYYALNTLFSMASAFFLIQYNGQKGKNIKWPFYWAYPVHITALTILHYAFPA